MPSVFPDGTYDVIVVDAGAGAEPDTVVIDLAVASGEHRGEVIGVTARSLGRHPLDLLAVPATLTVLDGEPSVRFEG